MPTAASATSTPDRDQAWRTCPRGATEAPERRARGSGWPAAAASAVR